jgi:hypothetical protein
VAPLYFTELSKDWALLICVKVARSDPSIFIIVIAEQSKEGCYDFDQSPSYHIAGAPYFGRLN